MSIVTKLVIWSAVLFVLVGYATFKSSWNNQYVKTHDYTYWQGKYYDLASQIATDPKVKEETASTAVTVQQFTLQQWGFIQADGTVVQRVDRCESCHAGVDNPQMTAEAIIKTVNHVTVSPAAVPAYLDAHPDVRDIVFTLGAHPGKTKGIVQGELKWAVATEACANAADQSQENEDSNVISKHAFATYGCTTCHYGSGRELVESNAHGANEFWLQPLLPHKYQEAACAQCHEKFDPGKFEAQYLPEMTVIARGQQLFKQDACWGCHKIEGFANGNVGPELTYEGRITTFHSIEHQLWDPRYKVNGCVMPFFFADQLLPIKDPKTGNVLYEGVLDDKGLPHPESTVKIADVENDDVITTLQARGYIPDAAHQDDLNALVTFVTAQTGLNYTQDQSDRIARINSYDRSVPETVPVTVAEGKVLFEQSGCSACHYLSGLYADPNKGGAAGPNLSWEGGRHSKEWIIAHYANPQAFVPKSIMPIFPLSNTQRAALSDFDASYLPKGSSLVSPDQDMPTQAMQNDKLLVPQVRYMTR
jgi:mono/diheme cytochrome c family protein